jgi:hypothetical protein
MIPGLTNTSSSAYLIVRPRDYPALLVDAYGLGNTVILSFDAPLTRSATNIANYSLVGGTITQAVQADDRWKVVLTVAGLVEPSFTISLSGILDFQGNPIDPVSRQGVYSRLQSADIYDPAATAGASGYLNVTGNAIPLNATDFDISGSGSGVLAGTQDAFQFVYEPWQDDFDAVVKVESLELTGRWATAGIMFRESLDPKAKCIWVAVTPNGPVPLEQGGTGLNQYEMASRLTYNTHTSSWPGSDSYFSTGPTNQYNVHYPHAWIRFQRRHSASNDVYCAWRSDDGNQWTQMHSTQLSGSQMLAPQGFLGLFVTVQNINLRSNVTHALFREYHPVIPLDWPRVWPKLADFHTEYSRGTAFRVLWRNESGPFTLQVTSQLKSPVSDSDWQDMTNNIWDDGTYKTWFNNFPTNNLFFRLIYK